MAGDWIPVRLNIHEDPAVFRIASRLKVQPITIVGALVRVWSWANANLPDGNARSVTAELIDSLVALPGLALAMSEAGWLEITEDGVQFPNFDRWNSQAAKRRALTARRVASLKGRTNAAGNAGANAAGNAANVSSALPREEKRREENKDLSDAAKPGRKRAAKPSGEKKPRDRNPLFDALAEVSGLDPATAGPRIGTAAALLAKAAPPYSPDEVREFGRRFWQLCPWAAEQRRPRPTPGEVANHIGLLRADPTAPLAGAGRVDQRTDYAKRTLLDALGIEDTPEDAPCPTRPPAATRPTLPSVPPPPG